MAMMISKFHKLIQSKVVWYIILGVIIIAFVGFFTPSMRQGAKRPDKKPVGELFGEKVMYLEYHQAYQNSRLWYILSSGEMPRMTDRLDAALRREAWTRLAALRKAGMEEIMVADSEVVQQIQQMPAFRDENGAFNGNAYRAILQQLGVSSSQLEGIVREQILLHKLMIRPAQAALISPYELRRAYHVYTDRFVLETALLPREQVEKDVTVSTEEAEAFFIENMEAFRMPVKVLVSYAEWNVADFIDQAEVSEETARQVYDGNLENYRIETTNEFDVAEYKPFDEVKEEITGKLLEMSARRLAAEEATALVAATAPQAEGEQPDFAGAAAAAGLTIKTLPAFGLADELQDIDETAPFRQAASRLQDDAYSSFSDAVVGQDTIYVLSLEKRYPSFLPEFEVVEDRVMEVARVQAVSEAVSARAVEVEETVTASLAAGSSFEEALKPYSLNIETVPEFDVTTELTNDYANILIPICLNTQQGELCQPVPMEEGVLIAYVAERKSTDIDVGLPAVRQELIAGLSRNRVQQLAQAWQETLLIEANFKNLMDQ